jgi:hypothetical protein
MVGPYVAIWATLGIIVKGGVLPESWRLAVSLKGGLGICLSGWEGGAPWANTNLEAESY